LDINSLSDESDSSHFFLIFIYFGALL